MIVTKNEKKKQNKKETSADAYNSEFFFKIHRPNNQILSNGENEEHDASKFKKTQFSYTTVIENRLLPIRKTILEDVIVPEGSRERK